MFQAERLEEKTKKLDLSHFDLDVVEQILLFIYTGKISKLEELDGELLAAAAQYQLQMLKNKCEKSLCKSLRVDNCFKLLIRGDMYHADNIKSQCLQFIASNRGSLSKFKDWKENKEAPS